MMKPLKTATRYLLDLIFPKRCVSCGAHISFENDFLCRSCRNHLNSEISEGCLGCGKPYNKCRCKPSFLCDNTLITTMPYKIENSVCRDLIIACKRIRNRDILNELAENMANALRENGITENYALTFAPRSPRAVRKCGFDQAEELARLISKKMSLPFFSTIICNDTSSEQKFLKNRMRRDNALKRFQVRKNKTSLINSSSFILVDDVVTSGATLNRCVEILYENGASEVVCLGAARTVTDGRALQIIKK